MRKCPSCGGDVLEEEVTHCSAECLINATHIKNSVRQADKYGWRFYEIEKRSEELEVAVLKLRRFMIFLNACLWVSFIALLMAII